MDVLTGVTRPGQLPRSPGDPSAAAEPRSAIRFSEEHPMLRRPFSRQGSVGRRQRHPRLAGAAGLVLFATLVIPAAPAIAAEPADMVLQWNAIALAAIGNAP